MTKEEQVEELQRKNLALVASVQTWVAEMNIGLQKNAGQSVTVFLQDAQPDTEQHRPGSRDAHACYCHFVVIRAANESVCENHSRIETSWKKCQHDHNIVIIR